jgi:alkanesulfonate monooxygenase SsuD/methylene tetrahydromethanopterin reductase-like flavin-dependent oxidoreductase (luciferase family)
MNIGLYLDLRNPRQWHQDWTGLYGSTLEICEEADRLGAHSIWLSEHHLFDDGYLPQPLTYAAAVAARTRQVRIGTAVTLAPVRSPVHLAEEAAVVDLLSGGRVELGIGAGYRVPEYELFGADIARRFAATDQTAREIRRLWDEGRLTPPPAQARPALWMGYQGPRGAERAGRLGECLLSANTALVEPYHEGLREAGLDPAQGRMTGVLQGYITDDPERDWPVVAPHLAHQWDTYRSYGVEGTGKRAPPPIDPDAWRANGLGPGANHFMLATPDDAAREIADYIGDAPVETVIFWASIGGMPDAMVRRHVQTICSDLAPRLRALATSAAGEGPS